MMKECALYILTAFVVLLTAGAARSEITGPEQAQAGQLTVFTSEAPAAWVVIPEEYSTSFYVDSDSTKMIFASPDMGVVTIVAATVVDGVAVVDTFTFYNGVDGPSPTPTPSPTPKPDTLEGLVKTEAAKVTSPNGKAEREAIAYSFQAAVDGIERGTITTPAGARATVRRVWPEKAIQISPDSTKLWFPLFDAISGKIEQFDLKLIQRDFAIIAEAIRPKEE